MKYVHVEGGAIENPKRLEMVYAAINQSRTCLVSLIGGLRQKNFGLDTLYGVATDIEASKRRLSQLVEYELYIDSGGYSIIKGDVESSKVHHFVECYTEYAAKYIDSYDYIFSLDIPFFGKEDEANTIDNIAEYNRVATKYMLNNFNKHPQLREKTFFVWHFKMAKQNMIWQKMYDSMGLKSEIRKRAIGGLVSIRNVLDKNGSQIDSSPFIHIAFKLLLDHLDSPYSGKDFYLHFLGVNLLQDRFVIALLEQLFSSFVGKDACAIHSYDSINVTYQAIMKSRDFYWVKEAGNCLSLESDLWSLPEHQVNRIYVTEELYNNFYDALYKLENNKELLDSSIFVPLSVYNNVTIDKYFQRMIKDSNLVSKLISVSSHTKLLSEVSVFLEDLQRKAPSVITSHFSDEVSRSISRIYDLLQAMNSSRPMKSIEEKLMHFIEELNFPDLIRG